MFGEQTQAPRPDPRVRSRAEYWAWLATDDFAMLPDDSDDIAAAVAQVERDGYLKCVTLADLPYEGRVV